MSTLGEKLGTINVFLLPQHLYKTQMTITGMYKRKAVRASGVNELSSGCYRTPSAQTATGARGGAAFDVVRVGGTTLVLS